MPPSKNNGLHSAAYFGETRDYWWNEDFLRLMARRWRTESVTMALDVGCGIGHWGRALLPVLPQTARLIGIDPEIAWVDEARKRAEKSGYGERATYRLGRAEHVPFHDDVFDLVTCQTVLIHLADPKAALREMLRVLKPGGLLIVAEPNNFATAAPLDSVRTGVPVEDIADVVATHLRCQRGKRALGEGDNSLGELVPGYFAELGVQDILVRLSDSTASALFPPYDTPAQEAEARELVENHDRHRWVWGRDETRRYFLAGGGSPEAFERAWALVGRLSEATVAALRARQLHRGGGSLVYLVSGRRPH